MTQKYLDMFKIKNIYIYIYDPKVPWYVQD